VSSKQASRISLVTEHGIGNTDEPTNGAISLWNEKLTVNELREKEEPQKIPQEPLEALVMPHRLVLP
jgi:hypothetical protein